MSVWFYIDAVLDIYPFKLFRLVDSPYDLDAIARQPEMQGKIQSSAIVLIAFVEAVALFAVVVSLIAK